MKNQKERLQNAMKNMYNNPLMGIYPLRFFEININDLILYHEQLSNGLKDLESKKVVTIKPLPYESKYGYDPTDLTENIRRSLENSLEKLYYSHQKILMLLPRLFSENNKKLRGLDEACFKSIYDLLNSESGDINRLVKIRGSFKSTETPIIFYEKTEEGYKEKIFEDYPQNQVERESLNQLRDMIEASIDDFITILDTLFEHVKSGHDPKLKPKPEQSKSSSVRLKVERMKKGTKVAIDKA